MLRFQFPVIDATWKMFYLNKIYKNIEKDSKNREYKFFKENLRN